MQEQLDWNNEHGPRQDEYLNDELDWRYQEYRDYHGLDAEDRYDDYEDDGDFDADDAHDGAADYQEQHEPGDAAGAGYAATRFPEFRRRGRGRIGGKDWSPPYDRDHFMPVFVRLEDLQRLKQLQRDGRAPDEDEMEYEDWGPILCPDWPPHDMLD